METVVKGKRTKRQRIHLLPAPVLADSSSGSSADREASMSATEEEEDMANCLILLAQGGGGGGGGGLDMETKPEEDKNGSKRTGDQSGGNYVYECKTCNKCFASFQALGGHRASHKKPRLTPAAADKKVEIGEDLLQINMNSFSRSINGGMIKSRMHECSICGSEFNSGQALGGHMRRHRPLVAVEENQEVVIKKERSLLELDLNLPAPSSSDDERGPLQSPPSPPAFELPLLFSASASALVDCHY